MSSTSTSTSYSSQVYSSDQLSDFGIKQVIHHGLILRSPTNQPVGTTGDVSYELGFCAQIDPIRCLLIASMDEQGGGDLCVGNDGFVFEKLSDIKAEDAIPINRVDPDYQKKNGTGTAFLAKFPGPIGFVPLGAILEDARQHPAAGTGFFISGCVVKDGKHASIEPESPFEMVQLRWDGSELSVSAGVLVTELLGLEVNGITALANAIPFGESLLLPVGVGDKFSVFQFDWNGERWVATKHGEPFITVPGSAPIPGGEYNFSPGELEPSLRKQGDSYFLYLRGTDGHGRLYESSDGFDYHLVLTRRNHGVPQVLNQGLDGSLYIATNAGPGMIRNPLSAYPLYGGSENEPLIIHDEEGIRGDKESKIPFIDHAVSSNVQLEGKERHFIFYRVCDLTERTLHTFQINEGADVAIYGEDGPLPHKLPNSGLYLAEFVY